MCRVFAVFRQTAAVLFWVIDEGSNIAAVFVVFEPELKHIKESSMTKENVVICPPCGENVAVATKRELLNKESFFTTLLPRLKAVLPPQGREITTHGFTLIELLVVVLIIGILAVVAVPQYKKAHEKTLLGKMFVSAKQLHQAQTEYLLANGTITYSLANLSVDFPVSNLSSFSNLSSCGTGTKLNGTTGSLADMGDYEVGIASPGGRKKGDTVSLACLKNECKCVGFVDDPNGVWGSNPVIPNAANLYGSPVCWQGIGVPGYASIWENGDWCSKTFHVNAREKYSTSNLSYSLIGL